MALCLLLGTLTACNTAQEGGDGSTEAETAILDGVTSATADGYELDNAIIAFVFYDNFQNFVNLNDYYLFSLGPDLNKSLKEQAMSGSEDTWFDYFMDGTREWLDQMVALSVAAKAENITLTDEDQALIDIILPT